MSSPEPRNLEWHRKETAIIINFNDGTVDEDFKGSSNDSWSQFDSAISEAGEEIRNLIVEEAGVEFLRRTVSIVWTADDVTYKMPSYIDRNSIISIHEVTNDTV